MNKRMNEVCKHCGVIEGDEHRENCPFLINIVFNNLQLKDALSLEFIKWSMETIKLFDAKQMDYGPENISGFGELGVYIRMSDKFARLKNLTFKDGVFNPREASNEGIEDTLIDIANYALIALMCRHGVWPGVS